MAEMILAQSWFVLMFPLSGFVVIGLWLGSAYREAAGRFAIVMASLTLLCSLVVAGAYGSAVLARPELYPDQALVAARVGWLNFAPGLTADLGILLDPISVMMMVVISAILFFVTVYSIGYMRGDAGFARFFALLDLFGLAMLGLVLSSNILQMFVFWELVGFASYALIGFWYEKPSAVAASKKAFVVTRFADAFFLLGLIVAGFCADSFDFAVLNRPETAALLDHPVSLLGLSVNLLTLTTILIFCGGWGKSAQFPLHVWLPDAMEGPTPVSSIIHSATMVVAGVFLTARMFPLFAAAPVTLALVQNVGAFTAIFAAVIAITQMDIKRILAFSTLSQLGYMMFSLGAAKSLAGEIQALGFSASMFHVFTHAFFKCMLFLGAGAVIHAVHHNDINHMGGLRRDMPRTYWSMLIACLAIAGIFPLSGFWSKDAILLAALQGGHTIIFLTGLLTGGLTAFYMFRLFFVTFHGERHVTPHHGHPVHEDPWMSFSIVALTVPAVLAGTAEHFFTGMVVPPLAGMTEHVAHFGWLPWLASLTGISGIAVAWRLYGDGGLARAESLRQRMAPLHRLVQNKFFIDEGYLFVTHRIIFDRIAAPVKWFDRQVVDGAMNLSATVLQWGGQLINRWQNGQMQRYLAATVLGCILLFALGFAF